MNSNVFFDSNIIVYLFDKREKEKHDIVNKLFLEAINTSQSFISVQVINEFIVTATKK